MIQKGQVVGGRYVIEAQLGQGGMGSVYRAVQQPLGRHVAIKVLRLTGLTPEENQHRQQRFFREAAFSSRLNHQHTVTVYDYGELPGDDGFFIAMELLQGQTLSELIRKGPMSVAMALHIATQIAGSLADAHAAGVIHRDLKPPNVMLVQRGPNPYFVKVVDFGLVKETAATSNAAELTGAQTILGSPMYMAPERFLYHSADTPSVDIYALGVLLYEMLVGRPPFLLGGDVTLHHVMMQHIKAPPPRMRELSPNLFLPAGLEDVIMRCLEKDPTKRYASMTTLLNELGEFQRHNRLLRTDPEISVLPDLQGRDMDATADDLPVFGEPTLMDKRPDVSAMDHPIREFSGATQERPAQNHLQYYAIAGFLLISLAALGFVFSQFNAEVGQREALDPNNEIPESVAKRLEKTPQRIAAPTPMPTQAPQKKTRPDVGPCDEDWEASCSNHTELADAFACLAAEPNARSTGCLTHLMALERTHYKGILLRAEADAIPSVRAPLPVEQLISGDTSTILCKQGESFALNAAGLEDTTSADRSIVQVTPKEGAHQLRCFSPGKTTLTHAGQEFPILVGVSDDETHEALQNKGSKGLEKCILNDLKDSFEQTVVARVAVEPDGSVSLIQRLEGTMPIETETCGLNVLKGLKLGRSNKPRVVDFTWDGRLPKYFEKIVKYVSTSRYTQAKKLCAPLLENGVMATECMPLSKQFPSFIQDGCNLLGDSAKGIFNCNPK